eukprot:6177723-Pleurochrysis_carterae.AAC.7
MDKMTLAVLAKSVRRTTHSLQDAVLRKCLASHLPCSYKSAFTLLRGAIEEGWDDRGFKCLAVAPSGNHPRKLRSLHAALPRFSPKSLLTRLRIVSGA